MGIVTTHTEGRVVTHSDDDREAIEVVQLPARDAAIEAANPAAPTTKTLSEKSRTGAPATSKRARTPAVKAAREQAAKRTRKARK